MGLKKNIVLICSNYAWTVFNFRLSLIKELKERGYKVVVLTQFDGKEKLLQNYVDEIRPLFISRKGINPFIDLFTLLDLVRNFIKIKPDYLLLFTIKLNIYGALLASFLNIRTFVTITGLGTAFMRNNWLKALSKYLYKISLKSINKAFFQNNDDKNYFIENNLVSSELSEIVPGSGVDLIHFNFVPLPHLKDITFLLIARLIWDKGIGEYIEASKIIKKNYPSTKFQILGPLGVENRSSISRRVVDDWVTSDIVEYLGEKDDVRPYIERASCIVLPSYREGMSKSLIEAASMGRPIVTSNIAGCKEIVNDGITGLLCKPKNHIDLAEKLEIFINLSFEKQKNMGIRAREKAVREFDQTFINKIYINALSKT